MSDKTKTAFISGHTDLTLDEFQTHYVPLLQQAVENNHKFIMAGTLGTDVLALNFLQNNNVSPDRITIYLHDKYSSRKEMFEKHGYNVKTGFETHREKDAVMTEESDYDIAYYRTNEESKQKYGDGWKKDGKNNVELNLERRRQIESNITHRS